MDISSLHTNQRLLIEALLKCGAQVRLLDAFEELIEVTYEGKKDFLLDRFSSKAPYHVVKMSADKHFAKNIMKENGINVPEGAVFTGNTSFDAVLYAKNHYPLVLKPNWGSHGDNVHVNINSEEQLKKCINLFIEATDFNNPFILERFHNWKEYRLFITEKGGFAVIHREWASVTGNGKDSIEKIIEEENKYRIELKKKEPTSLCPIVIDNEVHQFLSEQGIDLNFIPQLNQQIFLRQESNLAKGGIAVDMTEEVHSSVKELALKTLSCFPGLPVAGLDLLCEDPTKPISEDNYVIIEINSNPGLAMHTYPTKGKSRDVAQLLLDVMFPDFFAAR
jgi:D-alanine-D-alanine ligase-like ATP-grasp enzyme